MLLCAPSSLECPFFVLVNLLASLPLISLPKQSCNVRLSYSLNTDVCPRCSNWHDSFLFGFWQNLDPVQLTAFAARRSIFCPQPTFQRKAASSLASPWMHGWYSSQIHSSYWPPLFFASKVLDGRWMSGLARVRLGGVYPWMRGKMDTGLLHCCRRRFASKFSLI